MIIHSVGIDIGTSTTKLIFSQFSVENVARNNFIPDVAFTKKEIIYRSPIYQTPLVSPIKIDFAVLVKILDTEYARSGIDRASISTGAVIITGETARKENAEEITNALAKYAGDFVVAIAGPDLEAILAGFGAGADKLSVESKLLNFNIGGGTTNAVLFEKGKILDRFALNLGGRLLRFDEHQRLLYISDKILLILEKNNIQLKIGVVPEISEILKLTDRFASMLLELSMIQSLKTDTRSLCINHGTREIHPDFVSFSGGVAEFIYHPIVLPELQTLTQYQDIGSLLGWSIRQAFTPYWALVREPTEKIRATVIGAGNFSVELSGSTIVFDERVLPLKNIPVVKVFDTPEENLADFKLRLTEKLRIFPDQVVAIAFRGPKNPTYPEICSLADILLHSTKHLDPLIIIVQNDFAKALGQTLRLRMAHPRAIICLDKISVSLGNYLDIGRPLLGVIPVVVKTIVFSK